MRYRPITRTGDFNRAYRRGSAQVHPQVVVYAGKNRVGHTRVGITASKKIGNAVQRNRCRRIIRQALFAVLPQNVGGYDLVFVARGQTPRLKSTQLIPTLEKLLKKAGVPLQPQAMPPVKTLAATRNKMAKKGEINPHKNFVENRAKNT